MSTSKEAAQKEYDQALTIASQWHQRFIDMIQVKGSLDPSKAAHAVQQAEDIYQNLLNSNYKDSRVIYQLGTLYMQTNRNGLAIHLLSPVCAASKDQGKSDPAMWNALGSAFRNEHCNEEARLAFEEALKVTESPDVLTNLAALWVNEGFPERGIPFARRALELEPGHPQAKWNLGLLLLENEEYDEGFALYADGFNTGERIIRSYENKAGKEAPFWQGEDLNGKTIVLHGEQGIGDELLFLQFVRPLLRRYPQVDLILDVHPRLHSLVQRSFPEIQDIFPTRKSAPTWNDSRPVDYKDGLGSLPMYFHKERAKEAWLVPDKVLVDKYRGILLELQEESGLIGKPIVGISWEGGKKKTRTDLRSIDLCDLVPIVSNPALFVSLQYTPYAEKDTSSLLDNEGLYVHHWPDVVEAFDYDHSVALAAACDLVITVNTSIVHACGSMGHPCWTLTPSGCAWRYGKGERMPFYQSVLQFRQREGHPWFPVIARVGNKLREEFRRAK
jgi:tetratricopeptide (TPR) repeat protein